MLTSAKAFLCKKYMRPWGDLINLLFFSGFCDMHHWYHSVYCHDPLSKSVMISCVFWPWIYFFLGRNQSGGRAEEGVNTLMDRSAWTDRLGADDRVAVCDQSRHVSGPNFDLPPSVTLNTTPIYISFQFSDSNFPTTDHDCHCRDTIVESTIIWSLAISAKQ